MTSEVTQAEGPRVTIKASCFSCRHCVSESYRVQSDSGSVVYCAHPDFEQRKLVGDTVWDTPDWCPVQSLPELRNRLTAQSGEGRSGAGKDALPLLADQAWLDRRQNEDHACLEAARPVRKYVMPGDPPGLGQMTLQWYLNYEFGWPHSLRESNIAAEAFKDGFRAALNARQSGEGERE